MLEFPDAIPDEIPDALEMVILLHLLRRRGTRRRRELSVRNKSIYCY
jgi:hypothetical protein